MSRVAILKTVPFKREQENIIGFSSRSAQRQYFADLAGKSSFDELFVGIGERNFLPSTDTIATLRIDLKSYPNPFNTIEALNCQYAIVNYEYSSGSSNWGSGYLFYFITQAKSINMNTVEYSLELDVFNTYLRGIDWDLPNSLNVERTHIKRYTYSNYEPKIYQENLKYMLLGEGLNPSLYPYEVASSTATDLYCYIIVKGNVTEGKMKFNNMYVRGGTVSPRETPTSYWEGTRATGFNELYSVPYAIVAFKYVDSLKFIDEGQTYTAGPNSIISRAISAWSSDIVGIYLSTLDFTSINGGVIHGSDGSTFQIYGTSTNQYDYARLIFTSSSFSDNTIVGVGLWGLMFNNSTYNIDNSIKQTFSKNAIYSEDIKNKLYERIVVNMLGDTDEYIPLKFANKEEIEFNVKQTISEQGSVYNISLKGNDNFLYNNDFDSGLSMNVYKKFELPSLSDSYTNWLMNNKNYGATNYLLNPTAKLGQGVLGGASLYALSRGLSGPQGMALALSIGTGSAILGALTSSLSAWNKEDDIKNSPDTLKGSSLDLITSILKYGLKFKIIKYDLQPDSKDKVNKLFYKYGYSVETIMNSSELFNRHYFNYIKLNENISSRIKTISNISNTVLNIISDRLNNGVTIWDSSFKTFEYPNNSDGFLENWEQEIFESLPE